MGFADFPFDYSCSDPSDDDESFPLAECQDGVDNEDDGLIDFPEDPQCSNTQDNDENFGPSTGTDSHVIPLLFNDDAFDYINQQADMNVQPFASLRSSVLSKANSFGPDDFYSVWDDGHGACFYIDNSQSSRPDYDEAFRINRLLQATGKAYALTGNPSYAEIMIQFFHHWMIDPSTSMRPDCGHQIANWITVGQFMLAFSYIANYDGWDPDTKEGVEQWLYTYGTEASINFYDQDYTGHNKQMWRTWVGMMTGLIFNDQTLIDHSVNALNVGMSNTIGYLYGTFGCVRTETNRLERSMEYTFFWFEAVLAMLRAMQLNGIAGDFPHEFVSAHGGPGAQMTFGDVLDRNMPFLADVSSWNCNQYNQVFPITYGAFPSSSVERLAFDGIVPYSGQVSYSHIAGIYEMLEGYWLGFGGLLHP